jgi:hypothetical protein
MYEVENVPLSGSASFQTTEMVTEWTPAAASGAKFGSLAPTTPSRGTGPLAAAPAALEPGADRLERTEAPPTPRAERGERERENHQTG